MKFCRSIFLTLLMVGVMPSHNAVAIGWGKLVGQAAVRKILRKDLLRDRATIATALIKPRTVHRYVSRKQGALEARRGILPGSHMASIARRGRPLSAEKARRRYGLSRAPEIRQTISLPQGFPARTNKVLGGQAGYGEITSSQRLSPEAVRKVLPLR